MKLSEIFKTSSQKTGSTYETEKTDSVSAERMNRQIKALTPGRMLQGEVIGKSGSEVKIKLAGDLVLTAKMDRGVSVEEGKLLTFEVKNNGSTLTLSPLFANTANTDNIVKALQMANLPLNHTTVSMTEAMMTQGMSVDAKSLQEVFKDVTANPGTTPLHIVQLHQMGMQVNKANLGQMENYKALTHQLVKGITDVLKELPVAFNELYAAEGPKKAIQMYIELLKNLLSHMPEGAENGGNGALQADVAEGFQNPDGAGQTMTENGAAGQAAGENGTAGAVEKSILGPTDNGQAVLQAQTDDILMQETVLQAKDMSVSELLSLSERQEFAGRLSAISAEAYPELEGLVQKLLQGETGAQEVLQILSGLHSDTDIGLHVALADIFRSKEYHKLLEAAVLKQWSMEPEQVAERKVEEVYTRLLKQLNGIGEALENTGAGQSAAAKSVTNLSQNIDFMNQVNQLYTYVQLPLKMNGKNTNGELYVYTNKRSLAEKDGNVSAFLHLDMENLGPVDVYIAMQEQKVNTKFTVRDDDMLDFLNDHMHILNERLRKRGYTMRCEMEVEKTRGEEENPIDRILQSDKNTTVLSQYAFDVRA